MAKKKGKRITDAQRAGWLSDLERGVTVGEIARSAKVQVRTVNEHIKRARDDRLHERARETYLQSALADHYGDMVGLALWVRGGLNIPAGSDDSGRIDPKELEPDGRQVLLIEALDAHLPRLRLAYGIRRWNQLWSALRESRPRLSRRAESEAVQAGFKKNGSISDLLFRHALEATYDRAGLPWRFWTWQMVGDQVKYGAFPVDLETPHSLPNAKETIDGLLEAVLAWDELIERWAVVDELIRLRDGLGRQLDRIALQRVVPGSCDFCPGVAIRGRRRRRVLKPSEHGQFKGEQGRAKQ